MAIAKVKPKLRPLTEKYNKKYAYRVWVSPKYAVIVLSNTPKPKTRSGVLKQLKNPSNIILRSKDRVVLDDKQKAYAVSKFLSYVKTGVPELWLTKKGAEKAAKGARIAKTLEAEPVEFGELEKEAGVAYAIARLEGSFPTLKKAREEELRALAKEVLALVKKTEAEMAKKKEG